MDTQAVRTIAVIDDDRRVLKSLANLLASGGYRTKTFDSAEADYYLGKGAIGFFRKPIDGDALLQLLDEVPPCV